MNNSDVLSLLRKEFGDKSFTRPQLKSFCENNQIKWPSWFVNDSKNKITRGVYRLQSEHTQTTTINMNTGTENKEYDSLIPKADPLCISFGFYDNLLKIISSRIFYPTFITGLSGNGKTFMVEQVCAEAKREFVRVNITIETDEDDLLGGLRLIDGSTKWFDGPVIRAMKTGAVLLLDEVDLASSKIMCLQPILEGSGILLKKINQYVKPAPGFTIVATANTKGQGSESGKFVGTNILNEAFLERFPITFEHTYPQEKDEKKILSKIFKYLELEPGDFIEKLIVWANAIRKSYEAEAYAEIITTRRLVHIAKAFSIFQDRKQAIQLCLARFDAHTQHAFWQLYEKYDPSVLPPEEVEHKVEQVIEEKKEEVMDVASIFGTKVTF